MGLHRSKSPAIPLLKLWITRILIPLGGHDNFLNQHGYRNPSIAAAIGLRHGQAHTAAADEDNFVPRAALARLRQLHRAAELQHAKATAPAQLAANVQRLGDLVGLDLVERRILELAVLLHVESQLDDAADYLGELTTAKAVNVIAGILDLAAAPVRLALQRQSALGRSGLVKIDRSRGPLRHKLDLLSSQFADQMVSGDADPVSLLRGTVDAASTAELGLRDFEHIEPTLQILLPYLRNASAAGRAGVNILVHGRPGIGKSQLGRTLGAELDCEVFEVASEDRDGDPIDGGDRLRAFAAAQCFFGKRRALMLFDEVEDVFHDGENFASRSTAQTRKAWMNKMLEQNAVPTVWLSNSIRGIDPAFIRRFDMVFELPVPPKAQRAKIVRAACGGLVDEGCIERIAAVETLAPAIVTRAAKVLHAVNAELPAGSSAQVIERLISGTLQAQGEAAVADHAAARLPACYDPAFIRADADLGALVSGFERSGTGRLCLYGPPGTGKTAYGRWLAERLERPLLLKRASDLLSMYVGGNEKNIAAAFAEAHREGAVLLIDEVDSFLQNREGAQRGWEVTMVNEMLTQMESFDGIFIASTNLMDGLDPAALRRFDLKVRFDYLDPGQSLALLRRHCQILGLPAPGAGEASELARESRLTPGDYAAVVRQSRLRPFTAPAQFVAALRAECALKVKHRSPIGFVQ